MLSHEFVDARTRFCWHNIGVVLASMIGVILLAVPGIQPDAMATQSETACLSNTPSATTPVTEESYEPVYDYAILLDTSGSMVGLPAESGNADIFPDVKVALSRFIDSLGSDSTVVIMPFDQGVESSEIRTFSTADPGARDEATDYIESLPADGDVTWIFQSVDEALRQLELLRGQDERTHVQTLFLYTDGIGNGIEDVDASQTPNVDLLLERINGARTDQQYLYVKYVSLGVEPPEMRRLEEAGIDVLEEDPGEVTDVEEVRFTPTRIELGTLRPGESVETVLCVDFPDSAQGKRLRFEVTRSDLPQDFALQVQPPETGLSADAIQLTASLQEADGGAEPPPGIYASEIVISPYDRDLLLVPGNIPISFQIPVPPTPMPTPVTPTPTPIPTNTPVPTSTPIPPTNTPVPTITPIPATSTPLPTNTPIPPTETPLPTATPSPTPIPTPVTTLPDDAIELGQRAVSLGDDPNGVVTWSGDFRGTFANGAELDIAAIPCINNSIPLTVPANFSLRVGASNNVPEVRLSEETPELVIETRLPARDLQQSGEGVMAFSCDLRVRPAVGEIAAAGLAAQPDESILIPVRFSSNVTRPFDPTPWIRSGLIGLGIFALLAAAYAVAPRLPGGSRLESASGDQLGLRDAQAGLRRRWFGGPVSVGGDRSDVPLGSMTEVATVRGSWGLHKQSNLEPTIEGVEVDGEPLAAGTTQPLMPGDTVRLHGEMYTYAEGLGATAESEASSEWGNPNDDFEVRSRSGRLFGRKPPKSDHDEWV